MEEFLINVLIGLAASFVAVSIFSADTIFIAILGLLVYVSLPN